VWPSHRTGKIAVSGSHDRTVRLWDLATGDELRTLLGQAGEVFSVAVFADARLWNRWQRSHDPALGARKRPELKRLEGHENAVIQVVFSRDARFVRVRQ